jgi:hypothetical protein
MDLVKLKAGHDQQSRQQNFQKEKPNKAKQWTQKSLT